MIFSMVREEMTVSILCRAIDDLRNSNLTCIILFQTFLAEAARTVSVLPHHPPGCAVTFNMAPNNLYLFPYQQKFTESSVQIGWTVTAAMT